jgi:hypothetical protein
MIEKKGNCFITEPRRRAKIEDNENQAHEMMSLFGRIPGGIKTVDCPYGLNILLGLCRWPYVPSGQRSTPCGASYAIRALHAKNE